MAQQHQLVARLFNLFRGSGRPARRPAPRARLQVEALEAKELPSASPLTAPVLDVAVVHTKHVNPLAKFNGVWLVTYQGVVNTPFGSMPEHGSFPIRISNGNITSSLAHGKAGTVNAHGVLNFNVNVNGFEAHIHGKVAGNSIHGTFSGQFLGDTGSGTFSAVRLHK